MPSAMQPMFFINQTLAFHAMGEAHLVSGIATKRNSLVQSLAHDLREEQPKCGKCVWSASAQAWVG